MIIKMKLLSDAVFGNGLSIPGGEDISILCDEYGFPYYKGGTFKGVFREELYRYLKWTMNDEEEVKKKAEQLLGKSGDDTIEGPEKLVFSDFVLSDYVKEQMLEEIGSNNPEVVKDALSHLRTFTKLTKEGMAGDGSLRSCRCINKGLVFYSRVSCQKEDEKLINDVLQLVKWVGTMRNRGFGKVQIFVCEE